MKIQNCFLCLSLAIALTSHLVTSFSSDVSVSDPPCPLWTVPQVRNGSVTCICGNDIKNVILCNNLTLDVYIFQYYCMTYSEVLNKTVVGHCLYHLHGSVYLHHFFWQLPRQRNDTAMCQFNSNCNKLGCSRYQHQTGLMCTSCVDGYAYPVYSYSMACVECRDYKYNWLKYIAVAFLPLTVFYIVVLLFRIPATSGLMNGYILMCQLIATPTNVKVFSTVDDSTLLGLYFSLLAIWNLDFFRGLYSPFCIHPKLTTLQTLMFDYVIAVYPLLLVILTYFCVKLHNHFSIVVKLWSPFYKCFSLVRNKWDINRSLVEAFSTFILLSYVKILNVSFYALAPNTFYDVSGTMVPRRFLYYDGTYEFFGADHIPYAMLAMFMLLVFNIFPLVLLCLYPCRCFHKCLNYCGQRFLPLHIFMDAFHGSYKLQPQDCRLFAALYLFLRVFNHTLIVLTMGTSYFVFAGVFFIVVVVMVATIRPHKSSWHTLSDTIFFALVSILCLFVSAYRMLNIFESSYLSLSRHIIGIPVLSLPPLYGIGLILYFVFPKKVLCKLKTLLQSCKCIIRKQTDTELQDPLPYRFDHSEEYPPLLCSPTNAS